MKIIPKTVMSNNCVIKFKNRVASNSCDKRIAEAYTKDAKYDVDLITASGKIVSAHRFVLTMFSKYLAKILCDIECNRKILCEFLIKGMMADVRYSKIFANDGVLINFIPIGNTFWFRFENKLKFNLLLTMLSVSSIDGFFVRCGAKDCGTNVLA